MIRIRRSSDRGHFNHGWLDTFHTFSFSEYRDPAWHNFRALRVMNEDRVAAGRGFGMHPHRDMEIITYVLDGQLEHRDNIGGGGIIAAGDLQHLTAGTGIMHSEFNPSKSEAVHLYQIWLVPDRNGHTPRYEQASVRNIEKPNDWTLIASRDQEGSLLHINQDTNLYLASVEAMKSLAFDLQPGRSAWLQVLRGSVSLEGEVLKAGDGAGLSEVAKLELAAVENAEVMLFDLA